ncbi:hypothetical protein [Solibacillus sp. FSL K6-1126]|uniref:hypothetical protein n=1 Tax=Solibacillus sp. FSL K6-1126 TaxID=2921463 RepID=UPI0030FA02E9
MTKLYTWTFEKKRINIKKFSFESPQYLNVDIEYYGDLCLGYEKIGRYTFKFKDNRIIIYLAEDFSNEELNNLRINLKMLSEKMKCYSTSDYVYFNKGKELAYS